MSFLSRSVRLIAIFAVVICGFMLAMVATYSLPQARIAKNLQKSVRILKAEGLYPTPVLDNVAYRLDNFTDALMLDTSLAEPNAGLLVSAMAGYHGNVVGSNGRGDTIAALQLSAKGLRPQAGPYSYYWHGYQLLLRPALVLFTYGEIRYLNLLLLGTLLLVVVLGLQRSAGGLAPFAFAYSLLAAGFFVVPLSMQFSSVVYVALLSILGVLFVAEKPYASRVDLELFLVVGMVTSFVDLLTAPLLTLGMPLAVMLILRSRDEEWAGLRASVWYAARLSAIWAVGYIASWSAKWFIGSAVLKTDVVGAAVSQLAFRTGTGKQGSLVFVALRKNFLDLFPLMTKSSVASAVRAWPIVLVAVLILGALTLWLAVYYRKTNADIARAASVLIVVPLPYAWFVVANNHSAIHNWFTYRIQAIAIFAMVYFLLSCFDWQRVAARFRRISRPEPRASAWHSHPAEHIPPHERLIAHGRQRR